MKFNIFYKSILGGLQKVQSVVERKEIKPILSTILINTKNDKIEIVATNLETSLKIECPAEIIEAGNVVVDAKKIYEIIKEMPEEKIGFKKKENNWIEISSGVILFKLVGLSVDEFPEIGFLEHEEFQEMGSSILKEMIEKTLYASSTDESRHNLNGVLFEKIKENEKEKMRLVATDGHRLAIIDKEINEVNGNKRLNIDIFKTGVVFPRRGLAELKKMLEEDGENHNIYFLCKENKGFFRKDNETIAIRIIDEEFPNYNQAIPEDNPMEARCNRLELLKALKRISVIAEEKARAIKISVLKDELVLYASNPIMGEGSEKVVAEYSGDKIIIGFNARYLIEGLNAMESEEVVMKIKDADSPVVLKPYQGDDYICIVMPMEIKE